MAQIFRVERTKNFTVMSNHHFKNKNLTLKAKGLLSLMLSLPDDWNYNMQGLATLSRDGIDSVRSAIKELEHHGYVERHRLRNEYASNNAANYHGRIKSINACYRTKNEQCPRFLSLSCYKEICNSCQ